MSVYLQDADVTIHQGDVLDELRGLPSGSVHMCCTSPPFYGLRDYGTGSWEGGDEGCDHLAPLGGGFAATTLDKGDKAKTTRDDMEKHLKNWQKQYRDTCGKCGARRVDQQIGLEPTPDEYVARLVEVFREVRRVLRDDGTLWVEVGDSYASQGGERVYGSHDGAVGRGDAAGPRIAVDGVKPKDLIGAPWLLAFALRADGWYLRSEIIWSKPNPMPESVTDRPTTSHSRVFLLTKSPRYFYDADAVREPDAGLPSGNGFAGRQGGARATLIDGGHGTDERFTPGAGRNRRSVWTIATQPYPEAHFATWPEKLVEPMILAGTSERGVCPECGAPWQRTTESESSFPTSQREGHPSRYGNTETRSAKGFGMPSIETTTVTTGWQPSCKCGDLASGAAVLGDATTKPPQSQTTNGHVPALVLDPFAGSGTTMHVARKLGRRSIGIDLNPDYLALAARRLQQQSLFA